MRPKSKLPRFSWALYDFASTIFSMNIISNYFVLWLTVEKNCPELYYSLTFSSSVLLAAFFMPVLGEISDRLKIRMPFLVTFTLGCVVFTCLLGLAGVSLALVFFFCANFCYQLASVVYNSLLPQVSTQQTLGRTSGLGVSLGYVGAILGINLVKPFYDLYGIQATFVPTAILFLIFAAPCFVFVKDQPHAHIPKSELKVKATFSRLYKNLKEVFQDKSVLKFIITVFLCLNAVNTIIIYMSVYAKRVIGFDVSEIVYFMSVSIIFAIVGSYLFGHLTDRYGSRSMLKLVIKLWCLVLFLAAISVSRWMFWIVGPSAGICLGATWVCARTMLVELVPREKIGQMFGVFGLAGRFSSILGPVVWGLIVNRFFANLEVLKYRIAVGAMLGFMFIGYFIFKGIGDSNSLEYE
ncbi:MAG: MFS transporter [Candidatus Omnitrophica bacterium]|nr:MFS transporter [Candidatus Omnitrophota bacterium]